VPAQAAKVEPKLGFFANFFSSLFGAGNKEEQPSIPEVEVVEEYRDRDANYETPSYYAEILETKELP